MWLVQIYALTSRGESEAGFLEPWQITRRKGSKGSRLLPEERVLWLGKSALMAGCCKLSLCTGRGDQWPRGTNSSPLQQQQGTARSHNVWQLPVYPDPKVRGWCLQWEGTELHGSFVPWNVGPCSSAAPNKWEPSLEITSSFQKIRHLALRRRH